MSLLWYLYTILFSLHKIKEGKRIFCLYNVPCKFASGLESAGARFRQKIQLLLYIFFFLHLVSGKASSLGKAYVQPASLVVRIVVSRMNTKLEVPYPSCLALGQSTFSIFIFQATSNTTTQRNHFETTLNTVKFQIKLSIAPRILKFICFWCYYISGRGKKIAHDNSSTD